TQFLPFVLSQIQEEDAFWVIYWRSEPITERQYAGIFAQAGFELSASLTTDHAGNLIYTHRYDRRPADSVAAFGGDERVTFSLENYAIYGDVKAGETLRVQLLWTADQRPALDYSFSVFLLDSSGLLVNNHDGPPLNGQRPTSSWAANELVFDEHRLALPADLAPGVYTLGVKIYHYLAPSEPLPVICDPDQAAEACEWPILEQFPLD
ncbi:MAG: hypothetical protein GYB66_03100, partial [Chloroflexi bacterium]|nr:hypothetical protein [Chloroflexota bacterium]